MLSFDVIVIGAGPAAIAAIDALESHVKVACITGAVPASVRRASLHPKIRAVSSTRNETPGVAEPLQDHEGSDPLFSTAAIGGLANYWGQQFIPAHMNDAWPRDMFASYPEYLAACARIEALFQIKGGEALEHSPVNSEGFLASTPRLLMSRSSKRDALTEMAVAFRKIVSEKSIEVFEARVDTVTQASDAWTVALHDGRRISSRKIVMAAGVIGNAQILFRSFPEISQATFRDHTPWMLYSMGIGSLMPGGIPKSDHFNQLSIERIENGRSTVFASIYNMRYADLNLLLASTIGFTSRILRSFHPTAAAAILKPIQVWTNETQDVVEMNRTGETINYRPNGPQTPPAADGSLQSVMDLIQNNQGRVLKISRTKPGYGFHYHALHLSVAGSNPIPVNEFLSGCSGGNLFCVDASALNSIGCRPPTLTAMAAARRTVQRAALA